MLSFKQWLFESNQILENPKSPQDVFRHFMPLENISLANEVSQYVFKALYDTNKDKLYAWWVGSEYHGRVKNEKITYAAWMSNNVRKTEDIAFEPIKGKDTLHIAGRPILPVIYFNVKKRYMEILMEEAWPQEARLNLMKVMKQGKQMSAFMSKFKKIEFKSWDHSTFKIYF